MGVAASEFGVGLADPPGPRRQAHLARGIRRGPHIGSPRPRAARRVRSAPRPRSCGVSGTGSRDRSAGPSRRIPWHATTRSAVALRNRTGQRGRLHSSNLVGPRTGRKSTSEAIKNPGGAGGARTRDRQIMRSTLSRSTRLASNDASRQCHERTRSTGFFRDRGPRLGPRRVSLPGASPSRYVSHATIYPVRLPLSRTRSSACQVTARASGQYFTAAP